MNAEDGLPWASLEATDSIPWADMERLADALPRQPEIRERLGAVYDRSYERAAETEDLGYLYVAGVLALAGPKLPPEQGAAVARFLIQRLVQAGRDGDDMTMEVLQAACGSLGPICLRPALDALAAEPDTLGAWGFLWGLTALAADCDDPNLRRIVIDACRRQLRRVGRGRLTPLDGLGAAWTLAKIGHQESRSLIERACGMASDVFSGRGDLEECLDLLDGNLSESLTGEFWEKPVKEWLGAQWRSAKDWYEGNERDEDESGEPYDEDEERRRADDLAHRFHESSRAAGLPPGCREDAGFIAHCVLKYAYDYVGARPEELDVPTLHEVLTEVLPRKVSAERETFECMVPVTQALLEWLESEGILQDSVRLAAAVGVWADEIVASSQDPQNWGMAKGFAMTARAAGIDPADPDEMRRFMAECNLRLLAEQERKQAAPPPERHPGPVARSEPKVSRNATCPCGSGRKYKHCCGAR